MNDLLALYDREQRIEIEYPGTTKEITPEVVRFRRPAPGANFVKYAFIDEANADAVIQAQIGYFAPVGQKLTWDVYDHDRPADLKERLLAHGFVLDDEPPDCGETRVSVFDGDAGIRVEPSTITPTLALPHSERCE